MLTQTVRTQLVQALIEIAPLYDPAVTTQLKDVLDSMNLAELLSFHRYRVGDYDRWADLTWANFGTIDSVVALVQREMAARTRTEHGR